MLESVGQLVETKEHYQKQKQKNSLTKHFTGRKEIGDEDGEAIDTANLGTFFLCVGEKAKAEKSYHGALTIFEKIGRKLRVADCYLNLGQVLELECRILCENS